MTEKAPASENTFSASSELAELSDEQKQKIDDQSRPNAALIHETIRAEGVSELKRGGVTLALSALAAGLSMGFSLIVEGRLQAALPEGALRELVSPFGYTIGFLIVVLGRQQLFTENTLTPILALLHNRDLQTLGQVARLWTIVLISNVAGAMIAASAIAFAGGFEASQLAVFDVLAHRTVEAGFRVTFVHAVYAGWMIALMVWLLPAAENSRTIIIIIVTYIVSVMGFSHIIAGTVDCAYLVLRGGSSWIEFVGRFFVPTLLGNIVGGVALVAALNYGQVAPEIGGEQRPQV